MQQHRQELLDQDIIAKCDTHYTSPAFLMAKPHKKPRLLVDYRELNKMVLMNTFLTGRTVDIFMSLGGSRYFSCLDLVSAYYQLPVEVGSRQYTRFVTQFGKYVYKRTPFRSSVGPAILSRI